MDSDSSFADVLARLRAGDEGAAAEIFSRYSQRLIAVASAKLGGAMRRKVDAEDLVQSALKSFFRAEAEGALSLDNWGDLWALLTTITLRKCGYQVRQFMTAKRNVNLESPLDRDSDASWMALAREPTPAEAAVLSATIEEILAGLDGRPRRIVELTLQDLAVPEISQEVGLTERSVFRQLERLKNQLAARYRD